MIIHEDTYGEIIARTIIEHHGVLGMRWGVRRALYKSATKNFDANSPKAASNRQRQVDSFSTRKFGTKDFVIKKGSEISRIGTNAKSNGDPIFVSTNKQDATNYRAIVPTWGNKTGKTEKRMSGPQLYEHTFRATKDLRSPSETTRLKAYITLMDTKSIKLRNGKTIDGRKYLEMNGVGDTIKNLNNKQVALQFYGQLVSVQGMKHEPINSAFFKEISKRGYNAIIDENDAKVLARSPLVVLKPTRDLEKVRVTKLSIHDIHSAQASLKLPD